MAKPSEADVEAAKSKAKVSKVFHVTVPGKDFELEDVDVLLRMPRPVEFRRWQQQVLDESKRSIATEHLVLACTVWPELPQFNAAIEERPGALSAIGGELLEICGMKGAEKKVL